MSALYSLNFEKISRLTWFVTEVGVKVPICHFLTHLNDSFSLIRKYNLLMCLLILFFANISAGENI